MEKVKNACAKAGTWIKGHSKVVIAVVVVLVVVCVLINLIGGSEKRAVKKYLSALNSYDKDKIVKAMNIDGYVAWSTSSDSTEDTIADFEDKLDNVEDDAVDSAEKSIKDTAKSMKESKGKIKLQKIIYVATAKDNKDIKRVVFKYKVTSKATDDEKDEAKDSDIWKNMKAYNKSYTDYGYVILYKNKVISSSFAY